MFEGRKEEYTIARPQYTKDNYNYSSVSYELVGTARIYIAVEDRTLGTNNDLNLYTETLVGYTDDNRIDKNWLVDGKYIVKSVIPHRNSSVLYLKEYTNGR